MTCEEARRKVDALRNADYGVWASLSEEICAAWALERVAMESALRAAEARLELTDEVRLKKLASWASKSELKVTSLTVGACHIALHGDGSAIKVKE